MQFSQLLETLQKDYPGLNFKPGDHFAWNSKNSQITYSNPGKDEDQERYSNKLLHELAHAKLDHSDYQSDAQLLKIESSAWKLAKELCQKYGVKFSKEEQEDSLASYINWASSRSQCPKCKKNGLQTTQTEFLCPSCSHKWNVGRSRFTRTYRQS